MIAGTEGYAEHARWLFLRDEAISFAEKHQAVLHLLPAAPSAIIDIGSGTGADAAWFASQGHQVLAVEPTDELRLPSMALHSEGSIEWVNDSLPHLAIVSCRRQRFRLVMLTAVWMHLDQEERRLAMPNVASLLAPEGTLIMSLRHGPVPDGRRMFEVSAEETILLGQSCGLREILNIRAQSVQLTNRRAGVNWTHLAFVQHVNKPLHATARRLAARERRRPLTDISPESMKNYVRAKRLNVCGAPVFLHWSVLIVMGGCLAMAASDPIVAIVAAASYFSVILIHESGHAFVASRLGYEIDSIRLSVIHGECIYDASYETAREAALVAWGGPLAQFAAALVWSLSLVPVVDQSDFFGPPLVFIGYVGPLVALANLAPGSEMDGTSMAARSYAVAGLPEAEEEPRQSRKVRLSNEG